MSSSSSSSVFYRFRSAAKIEQLCLPGSAPVQLFEIKKAIVKHSGLGSGRSMEFDLLIANEETQEIFSDETERIARNTRLVVKRVPAAKGQGLLHRFEREECKRTHEIANATVPEGFYTIDSKLLADEEDEFVTVAPPPCKRPKKDTEFEKQMSQREREELTALQAVTEVSFSSFEAPGQNVSHRAGRKTDSAYGSRQSRAQKKPNADPELRSTEKPPEQRVRGVPVIMKGDSASGPIKINAAAFQELKSRTTDDNRIDFDTALILTSTQIPEFLSCAVCNKLLSNALCLHWDPEGRCACEGCIRASLSRDFRCPVTGTEGISPDDLHPNKPIQRAADAFREQVMKSAAEINIGQPVEELTVHDREIIPTTQASGVAKTRNEQGLENDKDKLDLVTDDFGGDVFDVTVQEEAQVDMLNRCNHSTSQKAQTTSLARTNNRSSPPRQNKAKPYVSAKHSGNSQRRGRPMGYKMEVPGRGDQSRTSVGMNKPRGWVDRRGRMAGVGGDRRGPHWTQNRRSGRTSTHPTNDNHKPFHPHQDHRPRTSTMVTPRTPWN